MGASGRERSGLVEGRISEGAAVCMVAAETEPGQVDLAQVLSDESRCAT